MFPQEKIDEIKAKHPDKKLYYGSIQFKDGDGKQHAHEFLYRKPETADAEAWQSMVNKNAIAAQNNLLTSLIVYPDPPVVMDTIKEYTAAVGEFIQGCINPFFGASVVVKSQAV